jgi:hypothetical protein
MKSGRGKRCHSLSKFSIRGTTEIIAQSHSQIAILPREHSFHRSRSVFASRRYYLRRCNKGNSLRAIEKYLGDFRRIKKSRSHIYPRHLNIFIIPIYSRPVVRPDLSPKFCQSRHLSIFNFFESPPLPQEIRLPHINYISLTHIYISHTLARSLAFTPAEESERCPKQQSSPSAYNPFLHPLLSCRSHITNHSQ